MNFILKKNCVSWHMAKVLIAAASFVGLGVLPSFADLKIDLIPFASTGGILNGQRFDATSNNATITFGIWATITTTSGFNTANATGIQVLWGDVVTANANPTNMSGSVGGATPYGQFTSQSSAGATGVDFSTTPDGSTDLGGVGTNTGNLMKFRCDPTDATGEIINSLSMQTNRAHASSMDSSHLTALANGYSFFMGQATFTLTLGTLTDSSNPLTLSYRIDDASSLGTGEFISSLNVASTAKWVENGVYKQASNTFYPTAGSIISIYAAIPEPGTWAMLVGGFGMLALGQRRRRRA